MLCHPNPKSQTTSNLTPHPTPLIAFKPCFDAHLHTLPGPRETELLEAVLRAWFMLGKLGGYDSSNLQVAALGV